MPQVIDHENQFQVMTLLGVAWQSKIWKDKLINRWFDIL